RNWQGRGADAAGGAVNKFFLPCLNMSLVAQTLQCSDSRHTYRGCLFKAYVRGLQRDCAIRTRTDVLSKRAGASAEDFVPRLEVGNILANCLNCSPIIDSEPCVLGFTQSAAHQSRQQHSAHEMSIERI